MNAEFEAAEFLAMMTTEPEEQEIRDLIVQAVRGSIEALTHLHSFCCAQAHAAPLLPLLRAIIPHIKPSIIPAESLTLNPESANDVTRAKWSLLCLEEILRKKADVQMRRIQIQIVYHWRNHIFPWTLFLQRRYLCDYPEDEALTMLEVLGVVQILLKQIGFSPYNMYSPADTNVMHFCIDAWYRLAHVRTPPSAARQLTNAIGVALTSFWYGLNGKPPPLVLETLEREHVIADAAFIHVTWTFKVASAVPICVDPGDDFLALAGALERFSDVFHHPQMANILGPARCARLLMYILKFFTTRRQDITKLSPDFKCTQAHPELTSEDKHNPTGQRCLIEGRIIDDCWMVFSRSSQRAVGIEMYLAASNFGLLTNLIFSGHTPRPESATCVPRAPLHAAFMKTMLPLHMLLPRFFVALEQEFCRIDTLQIKPFPEDDAELEKAWDALKDKFWHLAYARDEAREKGRFFHRCLSDKCRNHFVYQPPEALKQCSGCHVVRYCSTQCQNAHWGKHRAQCYLFQCGRSNWRELGHGGFLGLAQFEAALYTDEWRKELPLLYAKQAKHRFASPDYPVLKIDQSLQQGKRIEPFSSLKPLFDQPCWKKSLPVLRSIGHICVMELSWGAEKVSLLSPLTALSVLKRPDIWTVPPYKRQR
ncbi:hypothetical protein HGRIS_007381 [Hohenbuehelia grisea]|uniref:MYND-type domain-containing protein n=1 Tax=Hohenbuehelia grisea TaxID=104357 RepID=A0ABR3J4M1_9AGAR